VGAKYLSGMQDKFGRLEGTSGLLDSFVFFGRSSTTDDVE
jgi:hypothetical protein